MQASIRNCSAGLYNGAAWIISGYFGDAQGKSSLLAINSVRDAFRTPLTNSPAPDLWLSLRRRVGRARKIALPPGRLVGYLYSMAEVKSRSSTSTSCDAAALSTPVRSRLSHLHVPP